MITLTTGQPGAGKTLWTLASVKRQAEQENRPVYFSGIPQLALDWIELEKPEDWPQVPEGSIVVIDECQRLFRLRSVGAQVPEHVSALETHRHRGLDLFLVTQHPMLVDTNVRRLIGRHFHVQRSFGLNRATVHEFTEIRQDPDKRRTGSIRHEWRYPKDVFKWYKSAEIHTHKARIPVRVWMLLALPFAIGGLVWFGWQQTKSPTQLLSQEAKPGTGSPPPAGPSPVAGQSMTPAEYFASYEPRIPGLAHTAPRYDEVTQPQSAPVIAGCVSSARGCMCYTHQATRLDVDQATCRQIAEHGYYDDTQPRTVDRGSPVAAQPDQDVQPQNGPDGLSRDAGEIVALPGPARPLEENPFTAKPLPVLRNGGLTTG